MSTTSAHSADRRRLALRKDLAHGDNLIDIGIDALFENQRQNTFDIVQLRSIHCVDVLARIRRNAQMVADR